MRQISTCLWFDHQAEDATKFYATVFKNTKPGRITRYEETGAKISGQPVGSVVTANMKIENIEIEALNGGPLFKFTPALSYFVSCSSAAEIDDL